MPMNLASISYSSSRWRCLSNHALQPTNQGYTNCINVRDAKDGRTVDWQYREKLDKAARSGSKAKLEVAKVLAGEYDKKAIRAKMDAITKENPVVVYAQV